MEALGYLPEHQQIMRSAVAPPQGKSLLKLPGFLDTFTQYPKPGWLCWVPCCFRSLPPALCIFSPSLGQIILQLVAAVIAGYPIANRGVRALVIGRQITIDLLMSIATVGALLIGETGEAATVVLLFAIGESLEGYTAERARNSLRSLLALKPEEAHVMRPCIDCGEHMGQDGYTGVPAPSAKSTKPPCRSIRCRR